MFSNLSDNVIPILIIIILLLVEIIIVGSICFVIPMVKKINNISFALFSMRKKTESNSDSIDDVKRALYTIHESIESLSTSTNKVINEINITRNESIMPTPQLANMIRETINEQITIETLLSNKMKLPNKKSTSYIIENTAKTYPHVDKEYIVKLSMAMIENFALNEQEKQTTQMKK